jgi:hypothetical protein
VKLLFKTRMVHTMGLAAVARLFVGAFVRRTIGVLRQLLRRRQDRNSRRQARLLSCEARAMMLGGRFPCRKPEIACPKVLRQKAFAPSLMYPDVVQDHE